MVLTLRRRNETGACRASGILKTHYIISALILVLITSFACTKASEDEIILSKAVSNQGPQLLRRSLVTFGFRDSQFSMKRNSGRFQYERIFSDSTGAVIHDVLNNTSVSRTIDKVPFALDSAKARSVTVDVNSVVYFA